MYAVIKTGSHQYKVKEGEQIKIEKIEGKPGEKLNFSDSINYIKDDAVICSFGEVNKSIVNRYSLDNSLFFAEINAKTDLFSITRDVHGIVKVEYIEKDNIIEVSISKADVMLDVNLFGNNILLCEIDIAKYFTKSFTFEGIYSFLFS